MRPTLALLLPLSVLAACQGTPPAEVHPSPGYDCDIDTDPPAGGGDVPDVSLRFEWGGSEDPSDDSRTVWLKPKADGLALRTTTGSPATVALEEDVVYALEVPAFTSSGTGAGGAGGSGGSATRHAFLSDAVGAVDDFDLRLTLGTGWTLTDFTAVVLPADDEGWFHVFLLDVDDDDGFCVDFELGRSAAGTTSSDARLTLRLDPLGSAPDTPRATARVALDDLGVEGGSPATASPLVLSLRAQEDVQVAAGTQTTSAGLQVGEDGYVDLDHGNAAATLRVVPQGGQQQAQALGDPTVSGAPMLPLTGAFVFATDVAGTDDTAELRLATESTTAGRALHGVRVEAD